MVSLKLKFGNLAKQSHSSSKNPFKPSKRQDCFRVQLSKICSQVGLPLVQNSLRFFDRVCNQCGRKIRNLGHLYQFVKAATSKYTDKNIFSFPSPPPLLFFQPNSHPLERFFVFYASKLFIEIIAIKFPNSEAVKSGTKFSRLLREEKGSGYLLFASWKVNREKNCERGLPL